MTTKALSDKSTAQGKGFDFYDFKAAIEEQYGKMIGTFFAMAFREHEGVFLAESTRFARLVEWCDKELKIAGDLVNVFSPADKTTDYTTEQAKLWREQMHYVAELVYFRALLLDHRTTNKQRENIEYTICKLYGVQWNAEEGIYI